MDFNDLGVILAVAMVAFLLGLGIGCSGSSRSHF
jgi:hypothetical protein